MVESIVPGWFERSETVVTAEQTPQILQWTKVTVQFNVWQTVLKLLKYKYKLKLLKCSAIAAIGGAVEHLTNFIEMKRRGSW